MTPLIRFGIAWIVGIALGHWLDPPWAVVAFLALPTLAALWLYQANAQAKLWAGLSLALLAGAARLLWAQPVFDAGHVAFYNDSPQPIRLTGLVIDEPDVRDNYINLRLQAESIQLEDTTRPVTGLVLVRAPRYPAYQYGDRLVITGKLETPPIFKDFSYKDYLARADIHALLRRPRIELIASRQGHPFWTALLAFKAHASQTINRLMAEPHASLLNGILLGIESGIPEGVYDAFNLTGTSHIIVISGSNISLIAGLFLFLGQKLVGKRRAPPLAIVGIILYTFLVGADAAVSRAAIMGVIMVLSIWLGRPGWALNSLFASAILLTLLNPLILWDAGFQLSFMATLGLILLVPPLERGLFKLLRRCLKTEQAGLAMALLTELLVVTLAAQISTGPLLLAQFGRLSVISLLTNLLILPAQPPIMLLGGLATLVGMLWQPLGQLLAWLVWLPLAWTVWIVEWMAQLRYAALDLGRLPFWLVLLLYAALAAGIWSAQPTHHASLLQPRFHLPPLGSPATRLWTGGAGVITLLVWLAVLALPDGRLHVAFLDVGQGDAILVTTPDGRQLLIDGGPSTTALNWRLGQEMPFWDRSLEMVINTHPDADHLAGLVSLLDRYRVEQTIVTDLPGASDLYEAWEAELAEAKLRPTVGQAGMQLVLSPGITATLLSPGPATQGVAEVNNHSIVLRLQMGRISFLLSGDIEAVVEHKLIFNDAPLTATILKSPHHGSKTSSTDLFLETVNPQVVVISVGEDNDFGHPAPEVLARYAEHGLLVLRTDEQGTVEFVTDGERLWVEMAQ